MTDRTQTEIRDGRRALLFLPACIAAALTAGLGYAFLDWLLQVDVGWWLAFKVAGFLLGLAFGVGLMIAGPVLTFTFVVTAADPNQKNRSSS